MECLVLTEPHTFEEAASAIDLDGFRFFLMPLKLLSIPAGQKVVGPVLLDRTDVIEAKGDCKASKNLKLLVRKPEQFEKVKLVQQINL